MCQQSTIPWMIGIGYVPRGTMDRCRCVEYAGYRLPTLLKISVCPEYRPIEKSLYTKLPAVVVIQSILDACLRYSSPFDICGRISWGHKGEREIMQDFFFSIFSGFFLSSCTPSAVLCCFPFPVLAREVHWSLSPFNGGIDFCVSTTLSPATAGHGLR